jgi:hypothetical protein
MKPWTTAVSLLLAAAVAMAAAIAAGEGGAANYLVFVDPPPSGVICTAYQLSILAAALGRYEYILAAASKSTDPN